MKPGPRPEPTNLRVLRGNPSRRPIKPEPRPERPPTVPEPPEWLSEAAQTEWRRVSGELFRLGLLTVLDISMLAAYCEAYARWKTATQLLRTDAEADPETRGLVVRGSDGRRMPNPVIRIVKGAADSMQRLGSEFGLSPASRRGLAASVQDKPSKFDGLLAY
jgi:P27 family predicted phage terminase small subunit